MTVPHNIYIHVPFCISKCNYCAFFSRACACPNWNKYESDIINEILYWAKLLGRVRVPTVFFGGGTPSLMPVQTFEKIMSVLNSAFCIQSDCEITLESNPGTIDYNKLVGFINAGVNRLSIGVQSLDDNKLKFLGRRHNVTDAMTLIGFAHKLNLRTSADFIYGLPGETTDTVIQLCKKINSIGLTHCSLYELTIEPNTPFGKMNLDMPSNDEMANMYNAIYETLNLTRYEVSNYSTPGNECRHNANVWDGQPYIGIGRGAAGRILIDEQWYEQRGAGMQFEKISNTDRAIERVITGLRTKRGVYLDTDVQKILNMQYVHAHPELLNITNNERISATNMGMLVLDEVILNTVG